jgi:hypothetical protein
MTVDEARAAISGIELRGLFHQAAMVAWVEEGHFLVRCILPVQDAADPKVRTIVSHEVKIKEDDLPALTMPAFIMEVYGILRHMALHEAGEGLVLADGSRPFNPHRTPA